MREGPMSRFTQERAPKRLRDNSAGASGNSKVQRGPVAWPPPAVSGREP
jgi:hypothetical protein